MKRLLTSAAAFALFILTGCLTHDVEEPDPPTPVKADTARNVFAFLSPSTATAASDVYAFRSLAAAAAASDIFASVTLPSIKSVADLRADSAAPAFTYFSLKTGAAAADSNAQWDLAFRSTTIKVKGSSLLIADKDLDAVDEAPENGYTEGNVAAWYDYAGPPTHLITPKAKTVIVVKTSEGKYAKVQITSYYKGSPASPDGLTDTARYYSFKYLLQSDTTRSLKPAANPSPATYFSLKTGKAVADTAAGWDLSFRSTTIKVKGSSQLVAGKDFDDVEEAPESGYTGGDVAAWYDYAGPPTHLITPKAKTVIVIKTSEGKYAKVQVTSYYKGGPASPDGLKDTARYYSFKYLIQNDTTRSLKAAANPAPPTYFSLKTGKVVEDSAGEWDLSFRSTAIKFKGEAQLLAGKDFEQVEEAPEGGWSSGALPAWYDYSGEPNHLITPKPKTVILIKTADGKYGKIQVTSYYKGGPESPDGIKDTARHYSFKYLLQGDGSRNLKPAGNGAPATYFSLKTGKAVEDSTAGWDLAFRSTTIRVNGQARLLDGADFDVLKEAPESGYGTGALAAWYDYSGEPDHTISPKLAKVIAIKTADGKYAKVQILSYYKDAPATPLGTRDTARYYTFRYVLQADGSRNFETTTAAPSAY